LQASLDFLGAPGLTGWTGFCPVDHTAEKQQTRMAENAETKQLKSNCKASIVIEQDLIQQHPENPVKDWSLLTSNHVKKNQSLDYHKNLRRTK
jgi:hypothetical protein